MALPDLARLLPALLSAAQNDAPAVADAVRQYVPVSPRGSGNGRAPGTAAASLYSEVQQTPDGVSIGVYSDDPVVRFILEGTPPHTITAQHYTADGRLGYLVFEATDGGVVYTHEVFPSWNWRNTVRSRCETGNRRHRRSNHRSGASPGVRVTYSSVMGQMQTLLTNSNLLAGVVRGDTLRLSKKPSVILTPDQCPGAVITRGQTRERWLSLYIRDRQTPYFVDLWFYSTNQDTDNATYEALLENVQHVFTSQPQLAGGADTTTSKVLYLTLTQDEPLPRPFATTSGRAVYHDRFVVSVREEVRT